MKVICVDDEQLVLDLIVHLCKLMPQISDVKGFLSASEALEYLKNNQADFAFLDIDMPEMNGIQLAVKIKNLQPDIAIVFLTGYSHYAVEAFKIHANGYLLKPIVREKLEEEINHALSAKEKTVYPHIFAKTFGVFDFFVDGKPVHFSRSKSKELLAFLIDKQGAGVKRAVAFAAMYEDELYDRKMQKQFDVIVQSLKSALKESGAEDILEIKSGEMRVNTDLFECDLYRLLEGDAQAVNSYRGEYMTTYYWASLTEAYIDNSILRE